MSTMLKRITKPRPVTVKFVGDEDVIENITSPSAGGQKLKRKGQKPGSDFIYNHIAADDISDVENEDIYQPSQVLRSETDEVAGQEMYQVSPFRSKKSTPRASAKVKKNQSALSKARSHAKHQSTNIPKQKSVINEVASARSSLRLRTKQIVVEDLVDSDPENTSGESWDDNSDDDSEMSDTVHEKSSSSKMRSSSKGCKENSQTFAENYFFAQKNSKSVTSNRTLAKLRLLKTSIQDLQQVLKCTPEYHKDQKIVLCGKYRKISRKWMSLLKEGFSVLLYGIGSKYEVFQEFCAKVLDQSACLYIVIHGFYPSVTIKQVLNSITEDLIESEASFSNICEQVEFIKQHFASVNQDLYVIVHNIDGLALRGMKTQSILSNLASSSKIHFLASVDHINCSLIWDQIMLSQFNWLWYDATTYEPYILETSYENSLLREQSNQLLLSSLLHVFQSLTPNSRGVFLILARYQMDKKDSGSYLGITFQDWYQECRESFLVNSESTMNAQMSEFKNHKLLSSRKSSDSVEYWYIPVDGNTLSLFLEKEDSV